MSLVPVQLDAHRYDVHVRPGLLADAGTHLRELTKSAKCVVVANTHAAELHLPALDASLRTANFTPIVATFPPGEEHKTLATAAALLDQILPARVERTTPLLALGGGVTTDLAGLVAALALRGLPYVPIPTSLLAMVDASVGGKCGVNHAAGKNLVGAFHHPAAVLIDPLLLRTLPARELRAGLAECVKHEVIASAEGFARLERDLEKVLALDADTLAQLVAHNVRVKAAVVQADPHEHGVRAHLNLGHTFAHAFEKATHHAVTHGEAVAVGLTCASKLAAELKMMSDADATRIVALLKRIGLPTGDVPATLDDVMSAMRTDKKVVASRLRFVLPTRIGEVVVRDDLPEELVRNVVREALA